MKCLLKNVPSDIEVSVIIIQEKTTGEITIIFKKQGYNLEKIKSNARKLNSKIYEFQGSVGDLRKLIKNLKNN